ncbi:hypothetical protein FCV25MIE_21473 [Fagus crenata]|jgi:hypothetical protein|uniref:Transmembrane protein n=1 Tax=Fagus sylvatica TaxID=28930 RepID=A0A2N9IQR8_FAGSY
MSIQPQQQQLPQPQQQPVLVYPNTVTKQPPSHHSNGSFGTVFIVLAVIVVISAIACFLGRLCNRRYRDQKPKQNHKSRPKDGDKSRPRDGGDIEFGFDHKKGPRGKPPGNGGSRGHKPENGDHVRSQMKPEREPRAGASM